MVSVVSSRILFHTPQPLDNLDSGSSVRPAKLIDAFEQIGYNVDKVIGDTKERRQRIQEIQQSDRDYLFCYSEPTTWPVHPLIDYRLYWYLQSKNIPTGVFYRDILWKFPELFDHSGLKYWEAQVRYRMDLAVISRIADQIYVPSSTLGEYLNINSPIKPLPPGGTDQVATNDSTLQLERVIYVGGLSGRYSSGLLSKACKLAANEQNVTLDLVCREPEYQSLPNSVRQRFKSDWVTVHHKSGEALNDLYQRADAGIIPFKPTQYNNMVMPVKLFEYLSYGLPIITTNIKEVSEFVQSNSCGVVSDSNYKDLANKIILLSNDEELYQERRENAVLTLRQNRWIDRAEQVASDLIPQ
ncbi:glycosyltransferase [Haloplanus rallus]|uniref:Glycosyltransferase n=1 Tax=Haloplanus rallus TaxID=1816183 RepID=A0A6B9FEH4_9EURY|nr:glycosyltransferase [Haloplanus rallus]QGX94809.1 glycosyltransferase [Haloplanus rallus]